MQSNLETKHGKNFSAAQVGEWSALRQHVFSHPLLGNVPGKVFLKEPLQMTALEISFGVFPPGVGMPLLHAHQENEEVYIFVKGRGQILIDGEVVDVREGTVVRVAPEGARSWRNNGMEDLHFVVIQAKAGTLTNGTITDGYRVAGKPSWGHDPK